MADEPSELDALVQRAAAGDADAFGTLVHRFQDMAVGYAWGVLGDVDAARDAAQDAFVEAYLRLTTLRRPAAFGAWLRRIVFKHCDRQLRSPANRRVPLNASMADARADTAAAVERREVRAALAAALAELSGADRTALTMHYMAGASLGEIGHFLGVSAGAVKSRLHRARTRLRSRLEEEVAQMSAEERPSRDPEFERRVARLIATAAEGSVQDVRAVLTEDPDAVHGSARHPYWGGRPHALHVAAEWAPPEVVRELLAAGADPNVDSTEYGGWSPLLIAMTRGHAGVADVLREAGARVGVFEASAAGDDVVLATLLAADPAAAKRPGPSGGTPLHLAATPAVAGRLLAHGAAADARDIYGNTPLHSAASRQRRDVADVLMEAGAVMDAHIAAALGMTDRLVAMLRADPSLRDLRTAEFCATGGGGTPLHAAAQQGHTEIIRLLVELGADVDTRAIGGITPLHYAAASGRMEAVRLLLELGADIHARDTVYDGTPRDWAEFQRRTGMVAFLDGLMNPAG